MNLCGFVLLDLTAVVFAVGTTATIVSNAVMQSADDYKRTVCVRNLEIIGRAMHMYAVDHSGLYPANRINPAASGSNARVFLPPNTGPYNMMSYIIGLEKYFGYNSRQEIEEVWKCPSAPLIYTPPTAPSGFIPGFGESRVTYKINFWMLERKASSIYQPEKSMMFREQGNYGQSYAAAFSGSAAAPYTGTYPPSAVPTETFITTRSSSVKWSPPARHLHGEASHILFADGHVELFKNSETQEINLTKTFPERPGYWGLPVPNGTTLRLWITP